MTDKREWWEVHHEDCDCTLDAESWPPGNRCSSLRAEIQQEIERRHRLAEVLTDKQIDEAWIIARQRPIAHRRLARYIEAILRGGEGDDAD